MHVNCSAADRASAANFAHLPCESARAKEQPEGAFVGNSMKIGRGRLPARVSLSGGAT